MQISVEAKDVKNENGKFVIEIDSAVVSKILGLSKTRLSEIRPGRIIKDLINVEYIVLEHYNNTLTRVIRKDLLPDYKVFDNKSNNFATSDIRDYLNGDYFESEIVPGFGRDNVIPHNIDLLSLDGFDDYGICTVNVGLLTVDDYRKYHKRFLTEDMNKWWWLATPDSTSSGYGGRCVRYVNSCGWVDYSDYDCGKGVRPIFILKSNIFVSLVEE